MIYYFVRWGLPPNITLVYYIILYGGGFLQISPWYIILFCTVGGSSKYHLGILYYFVRWGHSSEYHLGILYYFVRWGHSSKYHLGILYYFVQWGLPPNITLVYYIILYSGGFLQISPRYIILFCTGGGFLQIFFARSFVDVLTFKNVESRHVYCSFYGMGEKEITLWILLPNKFRAHNNHGLIMIS